MFGRKNCYFGQNHLIFCQIKGRRMQSKRPSFIL